MSAASFLVKCIRMRNLLLMSVLLVSMPGEDFGQNNSALSKNQLSYEWNIISEVPGSVNLIYFIDPINGWIIADGSKIFATEDGGATWFPQNSGTASSLVSIYFIDNKSGFACGYDRT